MKKIIFIIVFLFSTSSILLSAPKKIASEGDFKEIYNSIVKIHAVMPADARTAKSLGTERLGSGVVIDDSHILTIGYLVIEAESIVIDLPDGKQVPAELVGYDHSTGFGIIKPVLSKKLKGLKIGNSDKVKQDENLYVLPSLNMGMPSLTKMVSRRPFVGWW